MFNNMKILSLVTEKSYFPEIYAYQKFFNNLEGFDFEIINGKSVKELYSNDSDVYLVKMGFDPFYIGNSKNSVVIHDYTSCSTGSFPKIKNVIKRRLSKSSDINIFLNDRVREEYGFSMAGNNIIRDMGVDDEFYYDGELKGEHECIYVGSIANSRGVSMMIDGIVSSNMKLSLVGDPCNEIYSKYKGNSNIKFIGKLSRKDTAKEMKKSIFGVNVTPNVYPYYFQTSTKLLEYCAANLKIITNDHVWSTCFMERTNSRFYITNDFKVRDLYEFEFSTPNVSDYNWKKVIAQSGIVSSLNKVFYD
ncbi:hypothetical protein [Vibrio alginolyticus]|uniref:hypothetical protein n=1 Tax=Vibrio alginolyticus TaxID=663 RepID=UPI001BD2E945|nr:hypothetical protein [Vibrio alginolyticus]MBS9918616.1 hypothetical protein [Vibrio alginolyticus]